MLPDAASRFSGYVPLASGSRKTRFASESMSWAASRSLGSATFHGRGRCEFSTMLTLALGATSLMAR